MADRIKYFEAIVDVKAQTGIGAFAYDKNEAKKIFDNYLLDNTVDNSSYIFEVNEQKVIVSNIHEKARCSVTEIVNNRDDF